ncbi:GMC oxidoreductase-domain-containing protein [Mycena vulgaris]|nr:GMC oxidoreductase-domain-containing protein [Mycena vulgaris]
MSTSAPYATQAEYDLVFAGGGTAGCIIASRLATAFPELTIPVLESGPTTKDKKEHIQPGQFLQDNEFYTSTPSEHVCGRSVIVPSARCIGGGSSVNFMIYNRPSASDFDGWENEFGNPGWGAKDMTPMLQKCLRPAVSIVSIKEGRPTSPEATLPLSLDDEMPDPNTLSAMASLGNTNVAAAAIDPAQFGRGKRKVKPRAIGTLSECLCGDKLSGSSEGVIQCNRNGCETGWYHLDCVHVEATIRSWTCAACASSASSSRANKRARRG